MGASTKENKALMRETKTMLTENLRTAIDKSIRSWTTYNNINDNLDRAKQLFNGTSCTKKAWYVFVFSDFPVNNNYCAPL